MEIQPQNKIEPFEVQNPTEPVESSRKRSKKRLIAVVVLLGLVSVVAAITIPVVLMNKNGQTSGWSEWSNCTVTCGNGTRQRMRKCKSRETACNDIEKSPCMMTSCREPAGWGDWGQWSPCSKTCSTGSQFRGRNCSRTDIKCDGDERQTKPCTLIAVCPALDCSDWNRSGYTKDGVYQIDPDGRGPFPVYCDMTTDGGGWTLFQSRQDGSEDFYRDWEDYKTGFGNLTGEFWLGNEYIHRLTAQLNTSLYIDIEDWAGVHHNASYRLFSVSNNATNYMLAVSMYTGDAGDSLTHHSGMMFSTEDRDNDKGRFTNCAKAFSAGWWFNDCIQSNLNGKYVGNTTNNEGIIWMHDLSTGRFQSMKATAMKLRPR